LSDNGTQFASKIWKNKLADMKIEAMFSPMRHPQANPSKRRMRELANSAVSTAVKHIKDGQNCHRTLKAGSA
jgi:transposase InsO family protein